MKPKPNLVPLIIPVILAIITELFYWPSRNYPFEFDDIPNIIKFHEIRFANLTDLFFSGPRWISYWLNTILYKFAGFNPNLYRQLNILLHIIAGLLIFNLIYKLLSLLNSKTTQAPQSPQKLFLNKYKLIISTLISALFLLHPVQTQTVTYVIQGQLEGLATLFVLLILNLFVISATTTKKLIYILSTVSLFLIALLATGSKEIVIVTPALIFLIDWFYIAQGDYQKILNRKYIYLSLVILLFGAYLYFLKPAFFKNILLLNSSHANTIGNIVTDSKSDKITPYLYLISEFRVILHYLYIFIWPFNLSFDYDWKLVSSFFDFASFGPFLILLIIAGYIIKRLRKNRIDPIAFGLLWFFIVILPRSSIIPSPELINDYKTYLASFGILLILALSLTKLLVWFKNKFNYQNYFYIGTLSIFIIFLGMLTYQRNLVSETELSYWSDIVKKAPNKARNHNNYGIALTKVQEYKLAIIELKKAISIEGKPANMAQFYWDPYNNLANLYALTNRVQEAVELLEYGLKFNNTAAEPYNNLGMFYINLHDLDRAEFNLRRSLAIKSYHGKALFNLAKVYVLRKQFSQALEFLQTACFNSDLDTEPQAHINALELYANVALHIHNTANIKQICEALLQYKPQDQQALFNLAGVYVDHKDYSKAIKIYQQLIKLEPLDTRYLNNLSEVYRRNHQPRLALETIEQALKLAPQDNKLLQQKARLNFE